MAEYWGGRTILATLIENRRLSGGSHLLRVRDDAARHETPSARPGRAAALARFLDHVLSKDEVWVCRRVDIARHWHEYHPCDQN